MTDAWRSITLTEFEHVVTGQSQSLLRVCGRGPVERAAGPRPVLVMETTAGEARFHPLRAPADRSGVMRAAYAVPTSLIANGARCWLELTDGGRIDLPVPEEGAARGRDREELDDEARLEPMSPETIASGLGSPDAGGPQSGRDDELARTHAQILALGAQVAEIKRGREDERQATEAAHTRISALERELAAQAPAREALREEVSTLQSRRRGLETELDQSRDQLRLMTFERDELSRQAAAFDGVAVKARERAAAAEAAREKSTATLNELQIWRGELERRLADTTSELGALRAARETDERECNRLRAALAEHERPGTVLGSNGTDSEGGAREIVAAQAQEIQRLAAELADLRSQVARGG